MKRVTGNDLETTRILCSAFILIDSNNSLRQRYTIFIQYNSHLQINISFNSFLCFEYFTPPFPVELSSPVYIQLV